MSEDERAPETAPPIRGQWAWQRVAALPASVRERCLDNAVRGELCLAGQALEFAIYYKV